MCGVAQDQCACWMFCLVQGTCLRTHGGVRGQWQSAQLPAVDLQQIDTPQGREGLDRRRGGVVGQLGNSQVQVDSGAMIPSEHLSSVAPH